MQKEEAKTAIILFISTDTDAPQTPPVSSARMRAARQEYAPKKKWIRPPRCMAALSIFDYYPGNSRPGCPPYFAKGKKPVRRR